MVPIYFSGSLCFSIIVFIAISSTVIEVKTFPQRQLTAKNYKFNHTSFSEIDLFSYSTLSNGSKWIVPRFTSNHHENFTFCRNKQTIRVSVPSNWKVINIPCWSTHYGFQDGNNIILYKGSPDTSLTPASMKQSEQGGILEFVRDKGFRYRLTNDWTDNNSSVLGRFTCFIANSSGENYVIAEYYRDDNAVNIYSSDCSLSYHVNDTGNFFCEVKGVENETDFQWSFKFENGKEKIFKPNPRRKKKYSKDGYVLESVKVKLVYVNTSEVVCRVKQSNSNKTFEGFLPIGMKDIEIPVVLDNSTVELYDEPGMNLTCYFTAEHTGSTHILWLQDGHKKLDYGYTNAWTSPNRTTTLTPNLNFYQYNTTNYTCIVSNPKGSSSKTFVINKPLPPVVGLTTTNPVDQSASQIIYICILAAFTIVLFLALVLEWKERYAVVKNVKNTLRKLEMNDCDSNSLAKKLDEDSTNWTVIGSGAYGQVWRTQVKLSKPNERKDVVAKSIMWYPTLRRKTAKILFDDFINEITYHGKLNSQNKEDYRKRYIVQYLGFYAPDVRFFRVYLVLEYCTPGQLESFLHKYRDERFFNDINGRTTTYRYEQRLRQEQIRGTTCLGISHLMKWAEQIALAMEYLHSHKIVHRDLAARNILLKGPNNYKSIDEVVALLADFGLSRSVEYSKNYVMNQKLKTKPRNLPLLWYPPESIGFGADVEYTTKSDVWSFGVLLWEIFSLGKHPDEGYGLTEKIQVASFKQDLQTRELELKRSDLKKIPDQIWLLMQRFWELCPDNRPDFSKIYENLRTINLSFGLVATGKDPTNTDNNQGQDATHNQADMPDTAQNVVEVNLDMDHDRVLFNHNSKYSRHGLLPISSVENQTDVEINSYDTFRKIDLELPNSQNISRSHSPTSDSGHVQVQQGESQVPVQSDEVSLTVWCKDDYVFG